MIDCSGYKIYFKDRSNNRNNILSRNLINQISTIPFNHVKMENISR
jgi:hypothetical protein